MWGDKFAMSEESGPYMKQWRKFRGFTQQDVADALGFSNKGYVSQLESGQRRYNQDHLDGMAKLFECTPADILSVNPYEPKPSAEIVNIWSRIPERSRDEAQRMLKSLAQGGSDD